MVKNWRPETHLKKRSLCVVLNQCQKRVASAEFLSRASLTVTFSVKSGFSHLAPPPGVISQPLVESLGPSRQILITSGRDLCSVACAKWESFVTLAYLSHDTSRASPYLFLSRVELFWPRRQRRPRTAPLRCHGAHTQEVDLCRLLHRSLVNVSDALHPLVGISAKSISRNIPKICYFVDSNKFVHSWTSNFHFLLFYSMIWRRRICWLAF